MDKRKVAILGAAGGIGQPLSLLMKLEPSTVRHLALYDIANMGMYADIGHISTAVKVSGHQGEAELKACLEGADIVMIPAGVPRKPGMTRDDLFNINATIVKNLTAACAKFCPKAHILVISNPVNSTVPIAYETLKAGGVANPSVFGVTTLDTIRTKTFVGEAKGMDPAMVDVKVVGGHSGPTIVPILSSIANAKFSQEEAKALVHRIQYGGDEVVKAKAGAGSATLSMAFAAREFYRTIVADLDGVQPAAEAVRPIAFVKTDKFEPGYFASELEIGSQGLKAVHDLPKMNDFEKELLEIAVRDLKKDVQKGIDFVHNQSQSASASN